MLDAPDFYNEIDKLAREKTLYDIDHNLIPDYEHIDLAKLEKQQKRKSVSIVKNLISKCPVNFDFEKNMEQVNKYMADFIKSNYPTFSPATSSNIFDSIYSEAMKNMSNEPLQKFFLFVEMAKLFYFYMQENYVRKSKSTTDILLKQNFITYSFDLLDGIDALLLANKNNSVISIYRTFYENFIVFSYLEKHPELQQAFIDHKEMLECMVAKDAAELQKVSLNEDVEKRITELTALYGEDFKDNYGWVKNKSDRNLKSMFEESELSEVFSYYYKLSCKFTHSTSLSLFVRPDVNGIYSYIYAIVEILIREFEIMFDSIKMINKDKALIKEWLNHLGQDVYKSLDSLRK